MQARTDEAFVRDESGPQLRTLRPRHVRSLEQFEQHSAGALSQRSGVAGPQTAGVAAEVVRGIGGFHRRGGPHLGGGCVVVVVGGAHRVMPSVK